MISSKGWVSGLFCMAWLAFTLTCKAGPTIRIAVAANFKPVLQDIARRYEQQSEATIQLSQGSTGLLYAQIMQGAPFDIFFAADRARPAQLEQDKLTLHRQTYALGRLAFWVPGATLVNVDTLNNFTGTMAIANPGYAPYGKAALEVLASAGVGNVKLVHGSNISQAFAFVQTGNAPAGLVALSLLRQVGAVGTGYWPVPASRHQPIEQQFVVLKSAVAGYEDFLSYLGSSEVRQLIRESGYHLPTRDDG